MQWEFSDPSLQSPWAEIASHFTDIKVIIEIPT